MNNNLIVTTWVLIEVIWFCIMVNWNDPVLVWLYAGVDSAILLKEENGTCFNASNPTLNLLPMLDMLKDWKTATFIKWMK